MHTHAVRTTLDKLQAELDALMPPDDPLGPLRSTPSDLVDLKVQFLGGRDVLAIAVHLDHDTGPAETGTRHIRVEEYGPDHRYFETEDGPALPPETAGLIEDARRTWVLFYGQDGRPTLLWLYRQADGGTIGSPIDLTLRDVPADDPVEELLEAIRLTQEYAQLPAVDGWSWWDAYRKYRPDDAERLRREADRAAEARRQPTSESEFVDDPDPMVWAEAFASRFTVGRPPAQLRDDEPVGIGDVAGLMVGWFSNFASAWERRVRDRIAAETTRPARVVIIRRQDNGWDRFAFVDDDGRSIAEFTVDPRHVTLVHDRAMPPEWIGHAPATEGGSIQPSPTT